MRILVTGSEGYIGTILSPYLLERGYDIVGLDAGFHRAGWLYHGVDRSPAWVAKDVRHVTRDDLVGFDAIVHMAELSNDPLGQLDPDLTLEINHRASVRLATLARDSGVERFVHMSSCSVYGSGGDRDCNETAEVRPLTAYAQCKVMVERDVSALATDDFSPTFLRNATAFGASPRMRFDLVVNDLAGHAWTERVIRMDSDGRPWRPYVHILDICQAIDLVLRASRQDVHNEIFNVGTNDQNRQVLEIAEVVQAAFPDSRMAFGDSSGDRRSYRADFDKIHDRLPFAARYDIAAGVEQLRDVFREVDMRSDLFESRDHSRIRQMQHLLSTGQIDARFFWVRKPGWATLPLPFEATAAVSA